MKFVILLENSFLFFALNVIIYYTIFTFTNQYQIIPKIWIFQKLSHFAFFTSQKGVIFADKCNF